MLEAGARCEARKGEEASAPKAGGYRSISQMLALLRLGSIGASAKRRCSQGRDLSEHQPNTGGSTASGCRAQGTGETFAWKGLRGEGGTGQSPPRDTRGLGRGSRGRQSGGASRRAVRGKAVQSLRIKHKAGTFLPRSSSRAAVTRQGRPQRPALRAPGPCSQAAWAREPQFGTGGYT